MKDHKHAPRHTKEIDADKLLTASKIELQIDKSTLEDAFKKNNKANNQVEPIDEIQEDLMHIIEKLSEFGNKLKAINSRLDKIEEITGNNYRNHQIEIDLLRRDLLGERKTFVYQSVIKSIIAAVDSLYNRKRNLSPEKDDLLLNQTTGILDNLQNLLKSIGYESFIVNEGEFFSTENMECVGFDEGEENKVIRVERLGFKTEYHVMRPCGVIIGRS
jgi:molecular chaperone GrpE (heat shock protein)